MQRYFVNTSANGGRFMLSGEDRNHIRNVMRMQPGDSIICVDSEGKSALCKITALTEEQVIAEVVKKLDEDTELPVRITIASGLPKGDKLEWIIQKGTELGAHAFMPFAAARSVVKWDDKKAAKKVERWLKIAKEAAEQSHRTFLPDVFNPVSFKTMLELSSQYDYKLAAFEEESRKGETSTFAATLKKMQKGESLLLLVGPEGGLTDEEINRLKEKEFAICGLGPRILRAETAPLYMLAAISYHFELLG
ncbi:16S rRNA (uracil(1498)-N(3))-methyltransferase [Neobacillus sp. SM06]|uniref:16S rRNA (uracil(1498)-N(3))-methyltransferase n=1 Tax=Neobacillus sp. SM06 TaxID=3422492 RepID=UPI003D28A563